MGEMAMNDNSFWCRFLRGTVVVALMLLTSFCVIFL
jgi:hypothetical protein